VFLTLALALCVHGAVAAADSTAIDTACIYRHCALGVLPVWNGLVVVRGETEERVAHLGFFWARDVSPIFADQPQALEYAHRAVRTRRTAALLTDLGVVLMVTGIVGTLAVEGGDEAYKALAIGGAVSFGIGVPLQFAADGQLSRAVWWHNTRFAGGPTAAP
jgi:hypothetical protein